MTNKPKIGIKCEGFSVKKNNAREIPHMYYSLYVCGEHIDESLVTDASMDDEEGMVTITVTMPAHNITMVQS